MKVNAKKIIVLISMVLLLVATGCLNYFLGQKANVPVPGGDAPVVTLNYFDAYRQEREVNRNQQISILDNIISSEVSSTDAIQTAESKRLEMVTSMEQELVLEGLIKARGFTDCVITMSTNNVNAIILGENLDETAATQIISLIVKQTGVNANNISIIPYV